MVRLIVQDSAARGPAVSQIRNARQSARDEIKRVIQHGIAMLGPATVPELERWVSEVRPDLLCGWHMPRNWISQVLSEMKARDKTVSNDAAKWFFNKS